MAIIVSAPDKLYGDQVYYNTDFTGALYTSTEDLEAIGARSGRVVASEYVETAPESYSWFYFIQVYRVLNGNVFSFVERVPAANLEGIV